MKRESFYIQQVIGSYRLPAVFEGTEEACIEYFENNHCDSSFRIVSDYEYVVSL